MIYLSTGLAPEWRAAVADLGWGYALSPKAGVRLDLVRDAPWMADNGAFSGRWDPDVWSGWLAAMVPARGTCLFAVVPDVVGDHPATRARWDEWAAVPRDLGYRPAFAAQDGCTPGDVPWDEAGALFVGGTDAFKLSETAFAVATEARRRGLWAHLGRVNSQRRLRAAYAAGYDSCDGSYVAFNPPQALERLGGYLTRLRRQAPLLTREGQERNGARS